MNRLCHLFTAAAMLVWVAATIAQADETRPNVVFFLVDDLGRADCGFMGGEEIRTPHIDKLAQAGSKLDAFYVQPLCSPTRAALLTGRYPMRYGLQVGVVKPWADYGLPLEEGTLAADLQKAGYVTGIFGKWHLGFVTPEYLPTRRGFTRQYGHYNGAINYFTHQRDGGLDWHKDDESLREQGYSTTLIGKHAARFVLDNANKGPFFLYVPFNAVHSPYQAPRGSLEEYAALKGKRRHYAAMLTATDAAIGEVMQAVEQAGVRENTLFVFSSDNGGPAPGRISDNGPYRGGKGTLYEGGVRVAAFATWDGRIPAGSTNREPMHIVDWRATLQRLCGGAASDEEALDGRDIWPTLVDGAPSPHEVILLNTTPGAGAVRKGDWKLVEKRAGARRKRQAAGEADGKTYELFNLRDDPYETTNLADQRSDKLEELRRELDRFAAEAVPPKGGGERPAAYEVPAVWGEAG